MDEFQILGVRYENEIESFYNMLCSMCSKYFAHASCEIKSFRVLARVWVL